MKITFTDASDGPPGLAVYQNGILLHPIVPEHFWAPVVDGCRGEPEPALCLYAADGAGEPFAGSMIFDSWEPGVGASLVANPDHYYRGVTYTVYANGTFTQTDGIHQLDEVFYGDPTGPIVPQYTDGPFVREVRFVEYPSPEAHLRAFLRGDIDAAFGIAFGAVEAEIQERLETETDIRMTANPN